jgi:hypothetical protein
VKLLDVITPSLTSGLFLPRSSGLELHLMKKV